MGKKLRHISERKLTRTELAQAFADLAHAHNFKIDEIRKSAPLRGYAEDVYRANMKLKEQIEKESKESLRYDAYLAVFNCHINNAHTRADVPRYP